MYRKFIKNMLKAEKYRYEAVKELLPEPVKKRVQIFEKDALDLLKDAVIEMNNEQNSAEKTSVEKKVKKVNVDFS